ncbi:unnamed protein product [Paramecium octaurelia]|uniref:Tetratricopeptide repeat protein n=1 Tax=Paramecium octaurelia TaxID=43137 RepID=A0A8S1S3R8_PAROT|nr:unnamed protein product [Paramecium octaurelia]
MNLQNKSAQINNVKLIEFIVINFFRTEITMLIQQIKRICLNQLICLKILTNKVRSQSRFYDRRDQGINLLVKLRAKNKISLFQERLQQLNTKQFNQALDWIIQYDDIKINLMNQLEVDSHKLIKSIKKVKQSHQKAYKLYDDEDEYEEAINVLDAALLIDQNHFDSLYLKDAIIYADKDLLIDSHDFDSLTIKAKCLKWLHNYKDAIIWTDKALSIDSKHDYQLQTKQALKFINQALSCDPTRHYSLYLKGECLQFSQQYEEAIIYYDKVLEIEQIFHLSQIYRFQQYFATISNIKQQIVIRNKNKT